MSGDRVLMRDPGAPDSPPYEAVASQVPFLRAAGWVEIEPEQEPEQQADGGEPDGEKSTESGRPRARAAKKRGDD